MDISNVETSYEQEVITEATPQNSILQLLAEGKPYLFLRASVQDSTLLVEMDSNIGQDDQRITRTILQAALKAIDDADVGSTQD